ncbi:hypothetical protein ACFYRN_16440 [Streptomyces sp. NPDC005227]|uniref:hypothetical protein n=1 Tax=Streptomyces sp. NPDC005227 TaxID=3364707 RepID=UPI0036882285
MITLQLFAAGAIGGFAAFLSLGAVVLLAVAAMCTWERLREIPEAWRNRRAVLRARRADFDHCRAIDALPTVEHPRE